MSLLSVFEGAPCLGNDGRAHRRVSLPAVAVSGGALPVGAGSIIFVSVSAGVVARSVRSIREVLALRVLGWCSRGSRFLRVFGCVRETEVVSDRRWDGWVR